MVEKPNQQTTARTSHGPALILSLACLAGVTNSAMPAGAAPSIRRALHNEECAHVVMTYLCRVEDLGMRFNNTQQIVLAGCLLWIGLGVRVEHAQTDPPALLPQEPPAQVLRNDIDATAERMMLGLSEHPTQAEWEQARIKREQEVQAFKPPLIPIYLTCCFSFGAQPYSSVDYLNAALVSIALVILAGFIKGPARKEPAAAAP